jgi:DNA-binding Lrp family transcriptional regulator
MWLTKNEKAVLKLLIEDAKLSDISIANTLNISSQAIGRIRKRLEKDVIKGYTVNLNSKSLGINIIALLKVSFNTSNENIGVEKLELRLKSFPEVIMILKTLSGVYDYII